MRKICALALAGAVAVAAPAFILSSAYAADLPVPPPVPVAPVVAAPVCVSFCDPDPVVIGLAGAGLVGGLVVVLSHGHHHKQVSP
jgi:hypothetical protein